jgi:hypothetical protein
MDCADRRWWSEEKGGLPSQTSLPGVISFCALVGLRHSGAINEVRDREKNIAIDPDAARALA